MLMNRMKVLACTMTIGVGGLAVFATPPSEPKAIEIPTLPQLSGKPASPTNGSDTKEPAKLPSIEFDLTIPEIPTKGVTVPPPVLPPVVGSRPILEDIVPVKAETKDSPKLEAPKPVTPPAAPPTIKLDLELPKVPDVKPMEKPLEKPAETLPPPVVPAPIPPKPTVPEVKPLPPSVPPLSVVPTSKPAKPVVEGTTKLKMLVRIDSGRPRFEIRNTAGEEVLFKAYGDKIEMQSNTDAKGGSPLAGVSAVGGVKFTAPGIEGTCDHLTILSGSGEVLMKGNVQMRTKRGRTWSEVSSEKMVYQIGAAGLIAPPKPLVRPTSYEKE